MKFGVVVFPGSNCDRDVIHVLEDVLEQEVKILWHKDKELTGFDSQDCIILPGGFSYGDYLRSGAIARFSPIMDAVISFANSGGYVLGICNGFQILCEAGLLPGVLMNNANRNFICKNVFIKAENNDSAITADLDLNKAYKIPIAHAEGNYFAEAKQLTAMNENGQIIFRYCDENASVNAETNANGALENIAGITNKTKNVFGMMPHPERAAEDILGNTDGIELFRSLISYVGKLEVDVMDDLLR